MLETFRPQFINILMELYNEYLTEVLTGDETAHRLMLTGHFNNMITRFH